MNFSFYIPIWVLLLLPIPLFYWLLIQTWVHYLAIMHLKRRQAELGDLKPIARWLSYWVVLPAGLWRDYLLNWCASVIFFGLPRGFGELLTGRLQRYVDEQPDSWRGKLAWSLSDDMLNDFDLPNGHVQQKQGPQ